MSPVLGSAGKYAAVVNLTEVFMMSAAAAVSLDRLISLQLLPCCAWLAVALASTLTTVWRLHFPQKCFCSHDNMALHCSHHATFGCLSKERRLLVWDGITLHQHSMPQNKGMLLKEEKGNGTKQLTHQSLHFTNDFSRTTTTLNSCFYTVFYHCGTFSIGHSN